MSASADAMRSRPGLRVRDRIAAALLLVVLAVGCVALWIGIPAASLYAASRVTETLASHFLIALPVTLLAMIVFAKLLFWINRLYLQIALTRGVPVDGEDDWQRDLEGPRLARGPLEPLLVVTLVLAIVAMLVWFFGFAENPSPQIL